jgi:hypothetical protein
LLHQTFLKEGAMGVYCVYFGAIQSKLCLMLYIVKITAEMGGKAEFTLTKICERDLPAEMGGKAKEQIPTPAGIYTI